MPTSYFQKYLTLVVAISNQTLSVLISKVEIIMVTSHGLGEDQRRSYMSQSFVNTVPIP